VLDDRDERVVDEHEGHCREQAGQRDLVGWAGDQSVTTENEVGRAPGGKRRQRRAGDGGCLHGPGVALLEPLRDVLGDRNEHDQLGWENESRRNDEDGERHLGAT
jgi:hypothetical protein